MKRIVTISTLAAIGWTASLGAAGIRTEPVRFERGASSAKLEGKLSGDETVHYLLRANAGQRMTLRLTKASDSVYFNVFEPGKKPGADEALFIGATSGSEFDGSLPATGEYLVQVYQVRSAARRGELASYTLEIAIVEALGANDLDALVPGTEFHATGELPCARFAGQPLASCPFGVRRQGGGTAEVEITFPGGGIRRIRFEKGVPASSDASEPLHATKESDLHRVTIGTERFEIPDAVVFGG